MSYFYQMYNGFSIIPQTFYPIYTQVPLNTMFQPFVLTNYFEKPEENNSTKNIETLQSWPNIQQQNANKNDETSSKKTSNLKKKRISKKKKDENFGWRNQNKDRNQISNILKSYVSFIVQGQGMIKVIDQIVKVVKQDSAVSKFHEFLHKHFSTQKTYIGIKYMLKILKNDSLDSSMVFILRKTLKVFLNQIYPLTIIQGARLKKKCKLSLLNKAREINNTLFHH